MLTFALEYMSRNILAKIWYRGALKQLENVNNPFSQISMDLASFILRLVDIDFKIWLHSQKNIKNILTKFPELKLNSGYNERELLFSDYINISVSPNENISHSMPLIYWLLKNDLEYIYNLHSYSEITMRNIQPRAITQYSKVEDQTVLQIIIEKSIHWILILGREQLEAVIPIGPKRGNTVVCFIVVELLKNNYRNHYLPLILENIDQECFNATIKSGNEPTSVLLHLCSSEKGIMLLTEHENIRNKISAHGLCHISGSFNSPLRTLLTTIIGCEFLSNNPQLIDSIDSETLNKTNALGISPLHYLSYSQEGLRLIKKHNLLKLITKDNFNYTLSDGTSILYFLANSVCGRSLISENENIIPMITEKCLNNKTKNGNSVAEILAATVDGRIILGNNPQLVEAISDLELREQIPNKKRKCIIQFI